MKPRSRWTLFLMTLLAVNGPSGSASDDDDDDAAFVPAPRWQVRSLTTEGDRYATLHFVLEKTFLKVDAVKVEVRVDGETTRAVRALVEGREKYADDLADSVSAVLLEARDADVDLEFLVSFSLEKFLDGSKKNIDGVAEAGLLSREAADSIHAEQPARFAFVKDRGMKDGDRLFYRVRGDTLHTRFIYREGGLGLEETRVGPERRVSLLGAYLGPRSDFRKGLIESLFGE